MIRPTVGDWVEVGQLPGGGPLFVQVVLEPTAIDVFWDSSSAD